MTLSPLYKWQNIHFVYQVSLTLVLIIPDIPCFANIVDPDKLASEEANWSGSALFAIKYANIATIWIK